MRGSDMIVLTGVLLVLSALGAGAQEPGAVPEVMFVLDGSGSMWGQVDGEAKIDAARRVMAQVIPALPAEVKMGLTAYGHREKGNCADVEVLIGPGSDDREALLAAVDGISPKGKTPIAGSVQLVCDLLKEKEEETTIVLVSDGEETCHEDPCGLVATLKETGIRFVLHVVGFGVTGQEQEQLACLAKAGGGTYFAAGDESGLLAALDTVRERVAEKVEQARTTTVKAATKIGKLAITMPEESCTSLAHIKIVKTADGGVAKTVEAPEADGLHPLLAGEYEIVMGFANPNYADPTEVSFGIWTVTGGATTEVQLGAVSFNIAASLAEMPAESVTLAATGNAGPEITLHSHNNSYYLFKEKPVPAGSYTFRIGYALSPEATTVAQDIVVSAGQRATVTIDSGLSLVMPQAGGVEGWDLVPAGGASPILAVRRRWDNDFPLWHRFAIPAGRYDLDVRLKGMEEPLRVADGLSIEAGSLLEFETGL